MFLSVKKTEMLHFGYRLVIIKQDRETNSDLLGKQLSLIAQVSCWIKRFCCFAMEGEEGPQMVFFECGAYIGAMNQNRLRKLAY